MMRKYHTKFGANPPDEVEAVQLTAQNVTEVSVWCGGHSVIEHDALDEHKVFVGLNVPTYLGMRRASEGWYILKNARGEFYLHSPGAFENLYGIVA